MPSQLPQVLNSTGGKARIAPWIVAHLPPHDIYVEPFGGSGAVLLAKPTTKMEVFNDLDGGLVHFFQVLASEPQELIKRVAGLLYSPFRDTRPTTDPVEIAARFFLHNNTTWPQANANNGFRPKNGDNERTVAVVFQKRKTLLAQVAARIRHVIFENRDAVEVIKKYDGPEVLFYLDPPYLGERRTNLYRYEMMDEASHRRLAKALHGCQGNVVLSGYSSDLYRELYGDWTFNSRLTLTNAKEHRTECLWIKLSSGQIRISTPQTKKRELGIEITTKKLRQYAEILRHNILKGVDIDSHNFKHDYREIIAQLSDGSRQRLNRIARRQPVLLEQITIGRLSVDCAAKSCRGPKQGLVNLSGQQFGHWTVLNDYKRIKGRLQWRCQCQCGTIKWVERGNLKEGLSLSCRSCSTSSKRADLAGRQFGQWTVLNQWKRIKKLIYWQCRCQCGTIKWIDGGSLSCGRSRSCRSCSTRQANFLRSAARRQKLNGFASDNQATGSGTFPLAFGQPAAEETRAPVSDKGFLNLLQGETNRQLPPRSTQTTYSASRIL